MSLLLTLVEAPNPQAVRQMRLDDGELVIGRSAEADWRLDDPSGWVSRAHCTIAGRGGGYTVTDTSTNGLYVDDAAQQLGPGRPMTLRNGMRLRLGDFVLRVELQAAAPAPAPQPAAPRPQPKSAFDADEFFTRPVETAPRPVRPRDLPDPFERPASFLPAIDTAPPERRAPPVFDDPFTLDQPTRHRERPAPADFDWGNAASPPPSASPPEKDFDWAAPKPAPEPRRAPPAQDFGWGGEPAKPARDDTAFDWAGAAPEPARPQPQPQPRPQPPRPAPAAPSDAALFEAFLRGLGIDPADAPAGDAAARMEAFGREYRMMAEGLMRLLKLRAQEKSSARMPQTVVGAHEVNPLKFMPAVDDALATMAAPRSSGFAAADVAIAGALRDLAAHHVGTWRGTQAALRRMIDRFDPAAIEKELEALGLLETLLAGGRRAKLWELYQKRFREIAQKAETQFLGEVGADFREAYEREG
ncbi:MAG: type VI secretion system-associated FHA domain protein TagH [Amaricoccus sp.]